MTFSKFKEDPWRGSHCLYQDSDLAMSPAPEYASSEVLLSALYRTIGFAGISEGEVPTRGRELDREVQKGRDKGNRPPNACLDGDAFYTMLHSVLESPKLPNQSSKRFLQVTPLVPEVASFSGSARLSSNSWPAGSLIRNMTWLGSADSASAEAAWQALFTSLSVLEDDDVFARFLESEIGAWSTGKEWKLSKTAEKDQRVLADLASLKVCPARQFVRDLSAIASSKDAMTRRQWTSLLEAVTRLAAVSHIAWICEVHDRTWTALRQSMDGGGPSSAGEAMDAVYPSTLAYLSYGDRALSQMKDLVSSFLRARLGINAVLWALEQGGAQPSGDLCSSAGIAVLCEQIRASKSKLDVIAIDQAIGELSDRENHVLLCKKGIGSNILEFARHALGQRQTASAIMRGYDQGYIIRKKGAASSSPWIVGLGPVAVLALVHCSLAGTRGPRSVHRLTQHLAEYGVVVDHRDIANNDLGQQLRKLGLVLDSPDAESGMLLVPPFAWHDLEKRGA